MIKKIILIQIVFYHLILAQNFGSLKITNYANDRKGAFSLTFDDGLKTQYDYVFPLLNQYGFKGTFYVIPPYLGENEQSLIWRYGSWNEFQTMSNDGQEIGSHTMHHYDLTTLDWGSINEDSTLLYELYQSQKFIEQKISSKKCISINYPYTIRNQIVDSAAALFYQDGRTIGDNANDATITGESWFKLKAKVVEFNDPRSSVSDDLDELYTFLDWLQNVLNNRKWGMIIIHDVVPFNQLQPLLDEGVYEPVTTEWLGWLCDFLNQKFSGNEVWVETVGNITRYIKEKETSTSQIISSGEQLIEINLTNNLDNDIYNYPLSGYVKIPDNWYYVRTEQSIKVDTLTTILTDTGRVALISIIPNNGIFKISPVVASDINVNHENYFDFKLNQNYPNPFNPSTMISWQSPIASRQTIKIYDILGNEITTLVDEYKLAGNYEVEFNSINVKNLSSGIYFYQLRIGEYISTRKMTLMK